jgi:hypothetical protein
MAKIKRREEEDKTLAKDATAPSMIDDLKKIREDFEISNTIFPSSVVPLASLCDM